jgi:hypothetical protein
MIHRSGTAAEEINTIVTLGIFVGFALCVVMMAWVREFTVQMG